MKLEYRDGSAERHIRSARDDSPIGAIVVGVIVVTINLLERFSAR